MYFKSAFVYISAHTPKTETIALSALWKNESKKQPKKKGANEGNSIFANQHKKIYWINLEYFIRYYQRCTLFVILYLEFYVE